MKIRLKKDSEFLKSFKKKPVNFRVESVIHDGQWYTPEKWAKVAKCSLEDVLNFIKVTDYLITDKGSYRVNKDEIERWYNENNLDIAEPLVPNNFVPKIWDGKTEIETFLNTPKYLVNVLLVYYNTSKELEEIKKVLKGKVFFTQDEGSSTLSVSTLRVYSISNDFTINYLKQHLPEDIIKNINFRSRQSVLWRNITDFSEEFIVEFLDFYLDYAKGLLKNHNKTIEIFIPNYQDRELKIQEWILRAAGKFDEKQCVPFSGYLANVLQRWPYDLPNMELGLELAKFQRVRTKAINKIIQERESEDYTEEEIQIMLPYTKEDYYRLLSEHDRWNNIRTASSITWDEKGNEKSGVNIFDNKESEKIKINLANKLSISLFKTAIETNDYKSLFKVIQNFKGDSSIPKIDLNEEFKNSLWKNFNNEE